MRNRSSLLFAVTAALAVAQEPRSVDAVRKYALNYVQSLPDYTCTQVTKRLYSRQNFVPFGGGMFVPGANRNDAIEEELSFVGGSEHYKVTRMNGFPAAQPLLMSNWAERSPKANSAACSSTSSIRRPGPPFEPRLRRSFRDGR